MQNITTATPTATPTTQVAARIDTTAPAKRYSRPAKSSTPDLPYELAASPLPDFYSDGFGVFITDVAAIRVDMGLLDDPERLLGVLERGGWASRMGTFPVEYGIVVTPYDRDYLHSACCMGSSNAAYSAWRIAQDHLMPLMGQDD